MNTDPDKHLDVCQNIEAGLKHLYDVDPRLTDTMCVFALENAKIAVKQRFGFAANEHVTNRADLRGVIDWCVQIGEERIGKVDDLTLKEYVGLIEKIRRSVVLHSEDGRRGYYEFIKSFLP